MQHRLAGGSRQLTRGAVSPGSLLGNRERLFSLTRRVTVEFSTDRQLLAPEARMVLLEELALRPHELSGVVLPHLLLNRVIRRCRQRQAGVDGMQLERRSGAAVLGSNGSCREACRDGEG